MIISDGWADPGEEMGHTELTKMLATVVHVYLRHSNNLSVIENKNISLFNKRVFAFPSQIIGMVDRFRPKQTHILDLTDS